MELYQILVDLLQREEKSKEVVRESEEEVAKILNQRTQEESASELDISVYDTERNDKAKKHRLELVRALMKCLLAFFSVKHGNKGRTY